MLSRLTHKQANQRNPKFWTIVVILFLIGFIGLQAWNWLGTEQRSLLPSSVALIDDFTELNELVPIPTDTFGASIHLAGLHTNSTYQPQGTISIVYERDAYRFVQIDYLPEQQIDAYLATHSYPTQEVKLDQQTSVWIQTIDDRPRCIDYEDDLPNRCEISTQLIAQLPTRLLIISADGTHPTQGELIMMARSILTHPTAQ